MAPAPFAAQIERGIHELDGVTLNGIVVTDLYNFDVDHDTAADVTSFESTGDGYARLTATARPERIEGEWVLFLDDIVGTDLSDEPARGGVVWVKPGGSDAARATVFYADDPGGEIDPYEPTYPDGAFSLLIESVERRLVPDATIDASPGQYARVKADGSGWEAVDVVAESASVATLTDVDVETTPPADGDGLVWDDEASLWRPGTNGVASITAAILVADADLSGGSFTTLDLVTPGGSVLAADVPRVAFVGAEVAVLSGDDGGKVWTVTSAGPCTLVRACQAGETVSVFGGTQRYVVQASNEVLGAGLAGPGAADRFVQLGMASIAGVEASIAGVEASIAGVEASIVPVVEQFGAAVEIDSPRFDLGAPELSSYTSGTYATTPPIDQFTDGFWAEAVIEIDESRFIADPPDGELEYLEITSQTYTAGDEGADIFEWAVESRWDGARWHHFLYYEHTPVGSTADSYKVFGRTEGGLELPTGTPVRVAVWCEFDTGSGESRTRLLVEAPEGRSGVEARGRTWRVDVDHVEDATDIEENTVDDWWIGAGFGRLLTPGVTIIDGGPAGTVVASPSATDAWAEGEGNPFDDAQANTWTPDTNAGLVDAPAPSGGGVALGETSTTAYRGDRGKTAYDHSQETGNPHGTTAGDVGAPEALNDATGLWLGTQAEYDAIGSPSATVVYVVVPS